METIVMVEKMVGNEVVSTETDFQEEYAANWFAAQFAEKEQTLSEFVAAFEQMEDKSSFQAEQLKILIDNLEAEITGM